MRRRLIYVLPALVSMVLIYGCAGRSTVFLHDEYNFQFIERVATIPFDNLTTDQGAGARATRIFTSELMAAEAFEVVEPGEVTKALGQYATVRTSELTTEQIKELGTQLRVQGIFFGSVTESSSSRSGSVTSHSVAMVIRLVETETGETVWSATSSAGGRGFLASLFGSGGKSASEVTRECARTILKTLIK